MEPQQQHHPPLNQITDEIVNAGIIGNLTLLDHLLKKHSPTLSVDDTWHVAVLETSKHRQLESLKLLLQYGANINVRDSSNGGTALHKAVGTASISFDSENVEVVQYLISNGADPSAKDNLGTSPLHLAARYGQIRIVQLLMEADTRNGGNGGVGMGLQPRAEVMAACSTKESFEARKQQRRCSTWKNGCNSLVLKASENSPATLRDVFAAVFCIPCFVK